jgi:hypothetical protein
MTTPKKAEILAKAFELFHNERARCGDPSFAITPTEQELKENGFISSAKSELMRNLETKHAEWLNNGSDLETSDFQFDIIEAMQTTTFISGSRGVGKSDIAMRIVDQLTSEGIISVAFDSSLDWLKRSSIQKYITVKPYMDLNVPDQNTIIDMSMLTPIQQQQCVERFCEKLFQHQIETECRTRFYVVFEESQIFFPLNSLRSKNTQNSMRLLTIGRNINTSICAISQFPSLIDCELRKNAQQIYVGCTSEPNTLAYWRGILGKNAEQLKDLENGEFVYYCRNKLSKIQIEPYENRTTKTRIAIPEPKPIEPLKTIPQANNTRAFVSLVSCLLWFTAILALLNQAR